MTAKGLHITTSNFLGLFMKLSVNGKQIDVGDALRTHVETQLKEIVGKFLVTHLMPK